MFKLSKLIAGAVTLLTGSLVAGALTVGVTPVYAYGEESHTANTKEDFSKENIAAFIDDYFETNMEKFNIPGAAISVVKDNEELLTAEYGVADMTSGEAVQADQTTFPACSVSKLYTATAIMQLSEQGKLDLNTDIRTYLPDVRIINPYDKAITCQQLLTHTAGLDEQSELDGSTLDENKIHTQAEYFQKHIPTVVNEPGSVSCYSNMGYNILGYIIEQVSGQSYEAYIKQHLLEPLQMNQSSVRIGDDHRAIGYTNMGFGYEKQGFAYQDTSGSSGVIATVKDMEHFMIMHLNHGSYDKQQILSPQTEALMQQKQFANHDVYEGMGYGWIRSEYNGNRILKHEGALPGYATTLLLLPDQNIGIYVATNGLSGICFDFEEAFLQYVFGDRVLSGKNCTSENVSTDGDLNRYVGTYRSYDGVGRKNIMKMGVLFDDTDMTVTKTAEGQLKAVVYNQKKEREETLLQDCGDGVFAREDGKGYISFRVENGKAVDAFTEVSHCTYERIGFLESKTVLIAGFTTLLILFVDAFILLIHFLRKKHKASQMRKYGLISAGSQLVTVIALLAAVILCMVMINTYHYEAIPVLKCLLILLSGGMIAMIGSSIYGAVKAIRLRTDWKVYSYVTIKVVIELILLMNLIYFQFIGIHIY